MKSLRPFFLLALLFVCWSDAALAEAERILNFSSHIVIQPDASAEVTETITVMATGAQIRHGIYRDFPTTYKDKLGNRINVGFAIKRVMRDGQEIAYSQESRSNGQRVYLGDAHIEVPPGKHTFVLSYTTTRQLGYFEDYDELYWNVTGNGWVFPIEHVEATVVLPPGASVLQQSAYTGYMGATGKDYAVTESGDGRIGFTTTRALSSNEGFTIAVAWPKGLVLQPTATDKIGNFFTDNVEAALALAGLFVVWVYYATLTRRMRRIEGEKTVIPLFEPPRDIPVVAVSYICHKGESKKDFAVLLVDMAVKGRLTISVEKGFLKKIYTLNKRTSEGLSALESGVERILFRKDESLILKQKNYLILQQAKRLLSSDLQTRFRGSYFNDNYRFVAGGAGLTMLSGFVTSAVSPAETPLLPIVILAVTGVLNFFNFKRVKSYTVLGKETQLAAEGFKMFLSVTEKERFNLMHPPEVTPELFEKYFPYALALGVENQWTEKFSDALVASGRSPDSYYPTWYSGDSNFSTRAFSSGISSGLSAAISAASAAPGSSSGSGGGGSSGGGGGGGGGGGF